VSETLEDRILRRWEEAEEETMRSGHAATLKRVIREELGARLEAAEALYPGLKARVWDCCFDQERPCEACVVDREALSAWEASK
jgi:hypothetical protein